MHKYDKKEKRRNRRMRGNFGYSDMPTFTLLEIRNEMEDRSNTSAFVFLIEEDVYPPLFFFLLYLSRSKIVLYFSLSATFVFIFICLIIDIKYFIFVIPYGSLLLFRNLYVTASCRRSIEFHVCMLHGYESVRKRIPIRASEVKWDIIKTVFL